MSEPIRNNAKLTATLGDGTHIELTGDLVQITAKLAEPVDLMHPGEWCEEIVTIKLRRMTDYGGSPRL